MMAWAGVMLIDTSAAKTMPAPSRNLTDFARLDFMSLTSGCCGCGRRQFANRSHLIEIHRLRTLCGSEAERIGTCRLLARPIAELNGVGRISHHLLARNHIFAGQRLIARPNP